MSDQLESQFNKEMWNIYRKAYSEANYKATRYLQMLEKHGGLETAKLLIHSPTVSEGYTALWERGRLDLTVEALIHDNPEWQQLFTEDELVIVNQRLADYEYKHSKERPMDERISRLTTPEECEQVASNVASRLPELAREARRRAVELRAEAYGAKTVVEREAIEAVYAYEKVLSMAKGKNIRASRTWQMIERHGIIEAVERAVNRPKETTGYRALIDMGMQDLAFEAVICRHPGSFSPEALKRSQERLKEWQTGKAGDDNDKCN